MITMELVERINYLSRKERYEGLTLKEKEEQQILRRKYLDGIRQQMVDALEGAGYTRTQNNHKCSGKLEAGD